MIATKYKALFNGALLLIGAVLAYKLYRGIKSGSDAVKGIVDDIKTDTQVAELSHALESNGINQTNAARVMRVAEDIYSALHKDSAWGMFEDEDKAIAAFNSLVSLQEAKAAAGVYQSNYSLNLYSDLKKYVHGAAWNSLKTYLINAIK